MKEENKTLLSMYVFIFVFIILILLLVRLRIANPSMEYSEVCKIRYGENWTFEYPDTFGQTCVEVDFVSLEFKQRVKVNFVPKDIRDQYCTTPSFWDLSEWHSGCEKFLKYSKGETE